MAMLKLFKSRKANVSFTTSSGNRISFRDGQFATDVDHLVQALETEIRMGHPLFYIDPAKPEISEEEYRDPLFTVKQAAVEQFKQQAGITTSAALTTLKESTAKAK